MKKDTFRTQHMAWAPKRTRIAKALISKLEKQVNMELAEVRLFFELIATAVSDYFAEIDWEAYERYQDGVANGPPGTATILFNKNRRVIASVELYRDARSFFLSEKFKYIAGIIGLDWEYIHRLVLATDEYKTEVAA